MNKNFKPSVLRGHLGSDPEVLYSEKNDNEFTVLNLGVNESYWDDSKKEWVRTETVWYEIYCFNTLANRVQNLKKGSKVEVSAIIRPRTIVGSDEKKYKSNDLVAQDIILWEPLPKATILSKLENNHPIETVFSGNK